MSGINIGRFLPFRVRHVTALCVFGGCGALRGDGLVNAPGHATPCGMRSSDASLGIRLRGDGRFKGREPPFINPTLSIDSALLLAL